MTTAAQHVQVGSSELEIFPLVLGGNVLGWTADESASFAVLDAFAAAGGTMIDTADVYSAWVPGHRGGESETIVGSWLAHHGRRDDVVVATKVGQHPELRGLARANVRIAAEASLRRLGTDRIDLYYAHADDAATSLAETAAAFSALVDDGLVRYIGLSNYTPERIDAWMAVAEREGLHRPVALQPQYNLVERDFESGLQACAARHGLGVMPYFGLARGFLAGKYRDGGPVVDSPRAAAAGRYLDDRGRRVLAALDDVARAHASSVATVALAWLRAQPSVVAPIASARTPEQLVDLVASAHLDLTADELGLLTDASA